MEKLQLKFHPARPTRSVLFSIFMLLHFLTLFWSMRLEIWMSSLLNSCNSSTNCFHDKERPLFSQGGLKSIIQWFAIDYYTSKGQWMTFIQSCEDFYFLDSIAQKVTSTIVFLFISLLRQKKNPLPPFAMEKLGSTCSYGNNDSIFKILSYTFYHFRRYCTWKKAAISIHCQLEINHRIFHW